MGSSFWKQFLWFTVRIWLLLHLFLKIRFLHWWAPPFPLTRHFSTYPLSSPSSTSFTSAFTGVNSPLTASYTSWKTSHLDGLLLQYNLHGFCWLFFLFFLQNEREQMDFILHLNTYPILYCFLDAVLLHVCCHLTQMRRDAWARRVRRWATMRWALLCEMFHAVAAAVNPFFYTCRSLHGQLFLTAQQNSTVVLKHLCLNLPTSVWVLQASAIPKAGSWFVLSELLPNPACEKAAKPHQDIYTLCLIIICHLWILDF